MSSARVYTQCDSFPSCSGSTRKALVDALVVSQSETLGCGFTKHKFDVCPYSIKVIKKIALVRLSSYIQTSFLQSMQDRSRVARWVGSRNSFKTGDHKQTSSKVLESFLLRALEAGFCNIVILFGGTSMSVIFFIRELECNHMTMQV